MTYLDINYFKSMNEEFKYNLTKDKHFILSAEEMLQCVKATLFSYMECLFTLVGRGYLH